MKPSLKLLALLTFLLLSFHLSYSQDSLLLALNQDRLQLNQTAMWVLGSWATGNIVTGMIGRNNTTGSRKYFHEMNAIWNVVNLGIAGFALYGSYHTDPASFDLWQTYNEQQKLEKILLFNWALNTGYMMTGAYLIERSKTSTQNPDRLKGYGQSLVLQGAFLFLFDGTQYILHHSQANPQLKQLLSQISVGPAGIGVVFNF